MHPPLFSRNAGTAASRHHVFHLLYVFVSLILLFGTTSASAYGCNLKFQITPTATIKTFQACIDLQYQGASLAYTYHPRNSTVDLVFSGELLSPSGWVGWGINSVNMPNQMVGSHVLIAFRHPTTTKPVLLPFVLTSSVKSQQSRLLSSPFDTPNITSSSLAIFDKRVYIFVSMFIKSNITSLNHVWNRGLYVQEYSPTVHPTTPADLATTRTIDFATRTASPATSASYATWLRFIHGTLNSLSWGFLLLLGAATARYFRRFPNADPMWFHFHVALQLVGYAAGVSGWALGLYLGSLSEGIVYDSHRKLGMAVFALGSLQMAALCFRPKKTHRFRKYWKSYHHLVGYACVVVGVVNVFQGFDVMQLPTGSVPKMAYCLLLASFIGVCIALEVNGWIMFLKKARDQHSSSSESEASDDSFEKSRT